MDEKIAIRVEGLSRYYGDLLAVDHITFQVQRGEIFGFLGPNGAGKTTTVRILTTLLEPTDGKAYIHGYDVVRQPYEAKLQLSIVPETSNVYDELSAWDNLIFSSRLYRVPIDKAHRRAERLLDAFGLGDKKHIKVHDFSKGMKRRLTIAMALIHQPKVLFLDEPTTGLDVQSAVLIKALVRELNAAGTTLFMTTHQIEEANELCDRVAIINQGRIAAIDTPERLKAAFQSVQSVEVAFDHLEPTGGEQLRKLPGVNTVEKRGDKMRLYTSDPPQVLSEVIRFAEQHRLKMLSLNTFGPSLEEVFLRVTGEQVR